MRLVYASALAIGLAVVMSTAPTAQGQDQDRTVRRDQDAVDTATLFLRFRRRFSDTGAELGFAA